jgi:hypothetical protein
VIGLSTTLVCFMHVFIMMSDEKAMNRWWWAWA